MSVVKDQASENEWLVEVPDVLDPMMLHATSPVVSKEVEAETVLLAVEEPQELAPQTNPLSVVEQTLEDGLLHPLAVVRAQAGHAAQAAPACRVHCGHVVADDDEQPTSSYLTRNGG